MLKHSLRIQRFTAFGLLGIAVLLYGCAVTPIEVKNASKAQIELIDSVESAVADMQVSLDQFHRDEEARILEEGRMLIARQAIDVAVSANESEVTADQLYDIYTKNIQPWVDYAFESSSIDERIASHEKRIDTTSDTVLKNALTMDLEDLRLLQAELKRKPQEVKELEEIIQNDLDMERRTATENHKMLEILRTQLALMKAMHGKVDAWLSIDVTVTQEQTDALKKAVFSAHQKMKGGGQ